MTAMSVMGSLNGPLVEAVLKQELKQYSEWQADEAEKRGLMTNVRLATFMDYYLDEPTNRKPKPAPEFG
jgi:hypothetical protein